MPKSECTAILKKGPLTLIQADKKETAELPKGWLKEKRNKRVRKDVSRINFLITLLLAFHGEALS